MSPSVRRFLFASSALIVAALIEPSPAEAKKLSCAFCYPYCPSGAFAASVCFQRCNENSSSASCSDPYNVCPGQVFVHCNGMAEQ